MIKCDDVAVDGELVHLSNSKPAFVAGPWPRSTLIPSHWHFWPRDEATRFSPGRFIDCPPTNKWEEKPQQASPKTLPTTTSTAAEAARHAEAAGQAEAARQVIGRFLYVYFLWEPACPPSFSFLSACPPHPPLSFSLPPLLLPTTCPFTPPFPPPPRLLLRLLVHIAPSFFITRTFLHTLAQSKFLIRIVVAVVS